jgi:hypothetical protein
MSDNPDQNMKISEGFEVFVAVTMNNAIFWDVAPCGSCENLRSTTSQETASSTKKLCLQLSIYLKGTWDLWPEDFQAVLRAAGETEATKENIQSWLQAGEGDPGFQLLAEEDTAAAIYLFIYFHQNYPHNFP